MLRQTIILAALVAASNSIALAAETKGKAMTYADTVEFLKKHTKVVELSDGDARAAICPAWQGRVMTSTCGGLQGQSFGFVNDEFINAGEPNSHFNNFGGEERLWLSPEGGQFSLWFAPGKLGLSRTSTTGSRRRPSMKAHGTSTKSPSTATRSR